jgi:hypothetical protein
MSSQKIVALMKSSPARMATDQPWRSSSAALAAIRKHWQKRFGLSREHWNLDCS